MILFTRQFALQLKLWSSCISGRQSYWQDEEFWCCCLQVLETGCLASVLFSGVGSTVKCCKATNETPSEESAVTLFSGALEKTTSSQKFIFTLTTGKQELQSFYKCVEKHCTTWQVFSLLGISWMGTTGANGRQGACTGRASQIQLPVGLQCPEVTQHQSSAERPGQHPQKPGVDEHLKNVWLPSGQLWQVHKVSSSLRRTQLGRRKHSAAVLSVCIVIFAIFIILSVLSSTGTNTTLSSLWMGAGLNSEFVVKVCKSIW